MKFEHILQIYWTKGYFFGGKLFYFNQTIKELFENTPGLGTNSQHKFARRFELTYHNRRYKTRDLIDCQEYNHKPIGRPVNILFSQIHTVNNRIHELHKLSVIRLYLIKSYRGRCHALGKPVRGQRTWSNAWSSYNNNKVLRGFISDTKRLIKQSSREEKINFKVVKKKYASKKKRKNNTPKKKKLMWF